MLTTAANAAWPDRTVTLIVPYAAGGISDVLARLTAEQLQARFKQTFIVQNEVGAGGIIGTANAAHAKPDGYTLLFGPIALLTLSPLTTKVNYDPDKDFEPVSIVASTPFRRHRQRGLSANTLPEFIAEVKKKPGVYTYASAGAGSTTHVASMLFLKSAGLQMIHVTVPRRRTGVHRHVCRQRPDALGNSGRADAAPRVEKGEAAWHEQQGSVASPAQRANHLGDLADAIRRHLQRHSCTQRNPREIVAAISKAIMDAVKTSEFSDKLLKVGVEPSGTTPDEMAKTMVVDKESWLAVKDDLAAAMKPQ